VFIYSASLDETAVPEYQELQNDFYTELGATIEFQTNPSGTHSANTLPSTLPTDVCKYIFEELDSDSTYQDDDENWQDNVIITKFD
jgi:hypothetical protein